jgi:hypothetical protein
MVRLCETHRMDSENEQRPNRTDSPLLRMFDLSAVRRAIAKRRGYDELIRLIDQRTDHASVVEDLRVGVATLNMLLKLGPGQPDAPFAEGDDLVRQSLFANAVMLYTRATHSQDRERPSGGLQSNERGCQHSGRRGDWRHTHQGGHHQGAGRDFWPEQHGRDCESRADENCERKRPAHVWPDDRQGRGWGTSW